MKAPLSRMMRDTMIVFALASVTVAACSGGNQRAADGYVFGKAEWDRPDIGIRFVEHRSHAELVAAFKGKRSEAVELMAWSSIDLKANLCTVHIVDPAVDYQPEWIGHEITHCLKGNWHLAGEAGQA